MAHRISPNSNCGSSGTGLQKKTDTVPTTGEESKPGPKKPANSGGRETCESEGGGAGAKKKTGQRRKSKTSQKTWARRGKKQGK